MGIITMPFFFLQTWVGVDKKIFENIAFFFAYLLLMRPLDGIEINFTIHITLILEMLHTNTGNNRFCSFQEET